MKWAWRIGRIGGITINLHATLLILVAWIGYQYYAWRRHLPDMVEGVLFISAFFVIVLLHELGHALAAHHYGIRTRDITLMPIGGLARMDRIPDEPRQELVVALAGPAVNVLIALLYWGTLSPISALVHPRDLQWVGGPLLAKLVWANLGMAVFNLVPAFPMDGGRVLRALLAMRLSHPRATRWAVDIGQALAFGFGAMGLYVMNPIWVFIALFVYLGAEDEAELAKARSALTGIPISQVMIPDCRVLEPSEPIQRAVEHTLAGFHHDFPVVTEQRVVGILTRSRLMAALARRGPQTPVGEVMDQHFQTAQPNEEADRAFSRLQTSDCRSLPIVQDGRLVGLLTTENVGEFLMIQSALRRTAQA